MTTIRKVFAVVATLGLLAAGVTFLPLAVGGAETSIGCATASAGDCEGECGCVHDPEGGPTRCLYWPDGKICSTDSDCADDGDDGGGGGGGGGGTPCLIFC